MLIFDGAFGTYYLKLYPDGGLPEEANVFNKDAVREIHKKYILAGANAIKTNTFSANGVHYKDRQKLEEIIKSGYSLAAETAEKYGAKVFADIGPVNCEDNENKFIDICKIFLSCGAGNFLFETQNEFEPLITAIKYIKERKSDSCIIVSFAVGQDGYTKTGDYYKNLLNFAADNDVDIVGLNCICGPAHILNLLKEVTGDGYNLIAMPNSGYPATVNQRRVYLDNPEYFASKLYEIAMLGVAAAGGCCGTTPEHISCFTQKLDKSLLPAKDINYRIQKNSITVQDKFKEKFIAVELPAPVDTDPSYLISSAKAVKEAGANFVTIPDSPLGRTRANSIMISSLVQRETGITAIPHLCCRDKNQIAIKGDLISGNIDGISAVLAITGDPTSSADRDKLKSVFGFNSYKLISFIKSLNEIIFAKNPYSIAGALNINALNFDTELERARKKIKNGANCLFTQPVFSEYNINNFYKAKRELNCKIALGILPLAGYKNAVFLNNEVTGIDIPTEIIEKLKDKSPEQTGRICINYAKSIIDRIGTDADGYYIMVPLKKIEISLELVRYIKEKLK